MGLGYSLQPIEKVLGVTKPKEEGFEGIYKHKNR